jgi:hypothetical protein
MRQGNTFGFYHWLDAELWLTVSVGYRLGDTNSIELYPSWLGHALPL